MEKGFFKTGDMGMYDQDGWLYVQGRIEDLITINDQRIFFMEMENVILGHPFVKDVAIIGNSKEVVACVVRKNNDKSLTSDKIVRFVSERVPSSYVPTKVVFMDNFPRTSVGKVKRRILREELLEVKIEYSNSIISDELEG